MTLIRASDSEHADQEKQSAAAVPVHQPLPQCTSSTVQAHLPRAAMGCGFELRPARPANGSSRPGRELLDVLRDEGAEAAEPRMGLALADSGPWGLGEGRVPLRGALGKAAPTAAEGRGEACCAFCCAMLRCGVKPSCVCSRSSRSILNEAPGWAVNL